MFGRCLRRSKKEENPGPIPDKLNETLEMLDKKKKVLQKNIQAELEMAKNFTLARNEKVATQCLQKKKLYETKIEELGNYQLKIQLQMILLEGAGAAKEAVAALRTGTSALKAMQEATSRDVVVKIMEEFNEQKEKTKQIQDAFATSIGAAADFDEDEVDAELEKLKGTVLKEQLLRPAGTAPAARYIPAGRRPISRSPLSSGTPSSTSSTSSGRSSTSSGTSSTTY